MFLCACPFACLKIQTTIILGLVWYLSCLFALQQHMSATEKHESRWTPVKNLAPLPVTPFIFIEYNPFICVETVIIRAEIMNIIAKEFECKDVYVPYHSDIVFALLWEALRSLYHPKIPRAGWHSGKLWPAERIRSVRGVHPASGACVKLYL